MPEPSRAESFQLRFLLLAVVAVSLLFLWMIRDFLVALLLAALAAALLAPVHRWLAARLGGRPTPAAALTVLLTLLLVVGPLGGLLSLVVAQAVEITQAVTPWVQGQIEKPDRMTRLVERLPLVDELLVGGILPERERVLEAVGNTVQAMGAVLVDGVAAAGRMTARFFFQLFIFLYALFFFLLGGRRILERMLYYAPLDAEDEAVVMGRFVSVTRATLKGSLVIGGLQGLLAGVAFWAAGIQGAAFWGTVMLVLSVIPGLGAPLIWVPATLWLLGSGQVLAGTLLGLWCAVVVGSVDNLLRPRLVGSDAKMSDLMILLGTLGGISLFGAVGFVLGPIVAAVFVTLWDVYGRAFAELLPDAAPDAAALGDLRGQGADEPG